MFITAPFRNWRPTEAFLLVANQEPAMVDKHPKANAPFPDPHGQAALLLVESLIHGLIASASLTVSEAVEIVNVASEVKEQIGIDVGDTAGTEKSLILLRSISASLERDLP